MLKKLFISLAALLFLLLILATAIIYWASLFNPDESVQEKLKLTQAKDLDYLKNALPPTRGKILAVVSSIRELGNTGRPTGYELTELARAYWVFTTNGFEVDIASPEGEEPYALIDYEDMGQYDFAFLNDQSVQKKIKSTLKLTDIKADNYEAVYFVGGKGAMFDFPDNPIIQNLVKYFTEQKKIIAAVCHGPAALVNVKINDQWLVANKKVSAFTNNEELLLLSNAETIFPFLLQQKLEERGAQFIAGTDYLEQISVSNGLVTGQNPWSVWRLAEETVIQLGYTPQPRQLTPEERSVILLQTFQKNGLDFAEKTISDRRVYSGHLVLMHAFVAVMKGEIINAGKLMILAESVRPLE